MTCVHHWMVEPPDMEAMATTLSGTCRHCGATREFHRNYWAQDAFNHGMKRKKGKASNSQRVFNSGLTGGLK